MSMSKAGRTLGGAIVATLVLATAYAMAQSVDCPSAAELAVRARAAKTQFRPLTKADAQQALDQLKATAAQLDQRLAASGTKEENWRKYVKWEQLTEQLNKAGEPDAAVLGTIYSRFAAGYEGLELKWFARVRIALRQYLEVSGAVGSDAVKKAYEERLDKLAGQLESWAKKPDSETLLDLGDSVAWLEDARQAPELTQAIHARFGGANFHAQIAGPVIAAGIAAPVDETEPIVDYILGTSIQGTGRTLGCTTVRLVPDPTSGVFDTLLTAVNHSRNTGWHHPVCIYSTGETKIGACKRFWMDECGLHAYPAAASADTDSTIHSIEDFKGRALVERFAWRRAGKQQDEADAIASQHAQQRVSRRVDEQAAPAIEQANADYQAKVRSPLDERLAFPRQMGFATVPDFIHITGWEIGTQTLLAPTPAPQVTNPQVEIAVRIHESAVNNLTATVLAGMVMREDMFQSAVKTLLGRMPEGFKNNDGDEPWTILFPRQRPITVSFADDGFSATIRGREFFRGDRGYPGMNITANYKFVKTPEGYKAVRQGDLDILPPGFVAGEGRLSARQQAIRSLLQKRLGNLFKSEIVPQGFSLQGKWAAAGKFEPCEIVARDGWLVIGWKRSGKPADPAPSDTSPSDKTPKPAEKTTAAD